MIANADSGSRSTPALSFSRGSFGIVHSPASEISDQRISATLVRRWAVNSASRTMPPNAPPTASAASQIALISLSSKMRARAWAWALCLRIPRTMGGV